MQYELLYSRTAIPCHRYHPYQQVHNCVDDILFNSINVAIVNILNFETYFELKSGVVLSVYSFNKTNYATMLFPINIPYPCTFAQGH